MDYEAQEYIWEDDLYLLNQREADDYRNEGSDWDDEEEYDERDDEFLEAEFPEFPEFDSDLLDVY